MTALRLVAACSVVVSDAVVNDFRCHILSHGHAISYRGVVEDLSTYQARINEDRRLGKMWSI
jgi:hypothetical protein